MQNIIKGINSSTARRKAFELLYLNQREIYEAIRLSNARYYLYPYIRGYAKYTQIIPDLYELVRLYNPVPCTPINRAAMHEINYDFKPFNDRKISIPVDKHPKYLRTSEDSFRCKNIKYSESIL